MKLHGQRGGGGSCGGRRRKTGDHFADQSVGGIGDVDVALRVRTDTDTIAAIAKTGLGGGAAVSIDVSMAGANRCGIGGNGAQVAGMEIQEPDEAVAVGDVEVAGVVERQLLRRHGDTGRQHWNCVGISGCRGVAGDGVDVAIHWRGDAELG